MEKSHFLNKLSILSNLHLLYNEKDSKATFKPEHQIELKRDILFEGVPAHLLETMSPKAENYTA